MLEVKKSPIHGKGLFATHPIKKDQVIGTIEGKPTKKNGTYVIWDAESDDGLLITNEFKYMNHSGKPNAIVYLDDLTVIAKKNIKIGDEITINYDGIS